MKKFFAIAFIAASMVACNNSGDKKPAEDTATTKPVDTAVTTPVDTTTAPADTTAKPAGDSTAK